MPNNRPGLAQRSGLRQHIATYSDLRGRHVRIVLWLSRWDRGSCSPVTLGSWIVLLLSSWDRGLCSCCHVGIVLSPSC